MDVVLLAVVVLSPVVAFAVLLSRRRDWATLSAFAALVVAVVTAAAIIGYRDYRSAVSPSPLLSDEGVEMNVTLFALLGAIVADWIAVAWGAWYWIRRGRRAAHRTRADRRREARGRVASPERAVTK